LAEQKALREILSKQLDADALKSFDKYMESHPVLPPPPAGGTPKGSGLDLGVVTPTKVTRRGFAFGNTPGGGIFDPFEGTSNPSLMLSPSPSSSSSSSLSSSSRGVAPHEAKDFRFDKLYERVAMNGLQSMEPLREGQDIEKYLHTFALTVGRLPMTEDQKIFMLGTKLTPTASGILGSFGSVATLAEASSKLVARMCRDSS